MNSDLQQLVESIIVNIANMIEEGERLDGARGKENRWKWDIYHIAEIVGRIMYKKHPGGGIIEEIDLAMMVLIKELDVEFRAKRN